MAHPFGELLTRYRARKYGLSQARLAKVLGYDPAVIARMAQGQKDLTGPTGREKVVRIIGVLHGEDVLHTLEEANGLLAAANMPPLYEGLPGEAALIDSLTPAAEPAPASRPGIPHNRPAPLTSFIGREQEVTELTDRIQATRLLTLTGSGGVGKSRLAQQVAAEALHRLPSANRGWSRIGSPRCSACARPAGQRSRCWRTTCTAGACCSSSTTAST
jgi:plasmid maintenance system antidote protein VapI